MQCAHVAGGMAEQSATFTQLRCCTAGDQERMHACGRAGRRAPAAPRKGKDLDSAPHCHARRPAPHSGDALRFGVAEGHSRLHGARGFRICLPPSIALDVAGLLVPALPLSLSDMMSRCIGRCCLRQSRAAPGLPDRYLDIFLSASTSRAEGRSTPRSRGSIPPPRRRALRGGMDMLSTRSALPSDARCD